LSFTLEGKTYVFEKHTEWYESLTDILADLEAAEEQQQEEAEDGFDGYFSQN